MIETIVEIDQETVNETIIEIIEIEIENENVTEHVQHQLKKLKLMLIRKKKNLQLKSVI